MAEILSTLSSDGLAGTPANGGARYVLMSDWELAQRGDLTVGNTSVLECYEGTTVEGGWQADGSLIDSIQLGTGWLTDPANFITIRAAAGSEATEEDNGFRIISDSIDTIITSVDYTRFESIGIYSTNPSNAAMLLGNGDYIDLRVDSCVLINKAISGTDGRVARMNQDWGGEFKNNLCISSNTSGANCYGAYFNGGQAGVTGDLEIYNNVFISVGATAATVQGGNKNKLLKNNVAINTGLGGAWDITNIVAASSNNASSDGTVPGTVSQVNISTADFESFGTGDYTPALGGKLAGTGTSPPVLPVDIEGHTRNDPDDIGAYIAAETPPIVDAGGIYTGVVDTAIPLSAASVVDGAYPTTVLWTVFSGGAGAFSNDALINPTFTPSTQLSSVLRLTATPSIGAPVFDDATLNVSTDIFGPTVDAGGPYPAVNGTAKTLDATVTAGSDPAPITTWTQPTGKAGSFGDVNVIDTTFTPGELGAFTLTLTAEPDDGPAVSNSASLTSNPPLVPGNGIWVGGTEVETILFGTTPVSAAYLGTTKIWPIPSPVGQQLFSVTGTDTFTVPTGVKLVHVCCIGGGGSTDYSGGKGGGLGYKNNIPVTEGDTITVVVGATGETSLFINAATVSGEGGIGRTGGGGWVGDGGGFGGDGGFSTGAPNSSGGGGGGAAGGYAGTAPAGGNGGSFSNPPASTPGSSGNNGSGGSGGGGERPSIGDRAGGAGGGTGVLGEGNNGSAGSSDSGDGGPGSGDRGPNKLYGGGAEGHRYAVIGGTGAVRVMWGDDRAYPSTNTGDA
jgi:hypothetical protein